MSYDSDQIFIDGLFTDTIIANCLSLNVVNVDTTDSPYSPSDSVVILADTSIGDVVINLSTPVNCDNANYIIKKLGASANKIIIYPPAGETIDGSASIDVAKTDEVLHIIRDDTSAPPNWVVVSYNVTDILNSKGQILTHNGTHTLPLDPGTDGQVLTVDSTASEGVRWNTAPHITMFNIVSLRVDVVSITPTILGYLPWDNSQYSDYSLGRLTFYVDISDRDLDVDVISQGIIIGSLTGINSSGVKEFTFTSNPTTDALIEVRAKKTAVGGTSPSISGINIIFNKI
jgi:hypothetical protein